MNSKLTGSCDAEGEVQKNITIFGILLSIHMKIKVVQHVPKIIFNIYKILKILNFEKIKFLNFSDSQRLSDFQTFFTHKIIILLSSHACGMNFEKNSHFAFNEHLLKHQYKN